MNDTIIEIVNDVLNVTSTIDDWEPYEYESYSCSRLRIKCIKIVAGNYIHLAPINYFYWHSWDRPTVATIDLDTMQLTRVHFWVDDSEVSDINWYLTHPSCTIPEKKKIELLMRFA